MYGWQRYLSIEQEFLAARQYVPYKLMKSAYSEFFTRQVIILGAEIESALKRVSVITRSQVRLPETSGSIRISF